MNRGERNNIIVLASILFSLLVMMPVFAQTADYGLQRAAQESGLDKTSNPGDTLKLAGTVIGSLLSIAGVAFFVLSVYGGFLCMTARGNDDQVKKGKNAIIAAVTGILIVIGSYALTNFVMGSVGAKTSPPLTTNISSCDPNGAAGYWCTEQVNCVVGGVSAMYLDRGNCSAGQVCCSGQTVVNSPEQIYCCTFHKNYTDVDGASDGAMVVEKGLDCIDFCANSSLYSQCDVTYVNSQDQCQ